MYIFKVLLLFFSYFIGIFILPFILLFTKKGNDKLIILDSIYGNKVDTINGDLNYRNKEAKYFRNKFWPRYNWVAFRNPAHNLAFKLGPKGIVKKLIELNTRPNSLDYKDAWRIYLTLENNREYFMYYKLIKWPFINRYIRILVGYKIWPDLYKKQGMLIDQVIVFTITPFRKEGL